MRLASVLQSRDHRIRSAGRDERENSIQTTMSAKITLMAARGCHSSQHAIRDDRGPEERLVSPSRFTLRWRPAKKVELSSDRFGRLGAFRSVGRPRSSGCCMHGWYVTKDVC